MARNWVLKELDETGVVMKPRFLVTLT